MGGGATRGAAERPGGASGLLVASTEKSSILKFPLKPPQNATDVITIPTSQAAEATFKKRTSDASTHRLRRH
jgi:hypothetical protein